MRANRDQIEGTKRFETGEAIQVLPLDRSGSSNYKVSITVTSARQAIGSAQIVRVASDTACFIKWGDSSVTASTSDIYFPAGVEVLLVPDGVTDLAFIRSTADGFATITQLG